MNVERLHDCDKKPEGIVVKNHVVSGACSMMIRRRACLMDVVWDAAKRTPHEAVNVVNRVAMSQLHCCVM